MGVSLRALAKVSKFATEPPEMVTSIASVDDPAYLADKLVGHLGIKLEDKQSLLECTNSAERLERSMATTAARSAAAAYFRNPGDLISGPFATLSAPRSLVSSARRLAW
jgi:ATP-dependent Lon protease